jgi:hypothetical protein
MGTRKAQKEILLCGNIPPVCSKAAVEDTARKGVTTISTTSSCIVNNIREEHQTIEEYKLQFKD